MGDSQLDFTGLPLNHPLLMKLSNYPNEPLPPFSPTAPSHPSANLPQRNFSDPVFMFIATFDTFCLRPRPLLVYLSCNFILKNEEKALDALAEALFINCCCLQPVLNEGVAVYRAAIRVNGCSALSPGQISKTAESAVVSESQTEVPSVSRTGLGSRDVPAFAVLLVKLHSRKVGSKVAQPLVQRVIMF